MNSCSKEIMHWAIVRSSQPIWLCQSGQRIFRVFFEAGNGSPDGPKMELIIFREFTLAAQDVESLLVAFLSEVLYWMETDQAGYLDIEIRMENSTCRLAQLEIQLKNKADKSKAVTFHNLAIQHTERGWKR